MAVNKISTAFLSKNIRQCSNVQLAAIFIIVVVECLQKQVFNMSKMIEMISYSKKVVTAKNAIK